MDEIICSRCGQPKPAREFGLLKLHRWCRECRRERKREQAPKKNCESCGRLLPYGAFAYNSQSPDGRHPWCNECRQKSQLIVCTRCLQPKPIDEFGKDKNRPNGIHPWCNQCRAEYRDDHAADIQAYNQQYDATAYYHQNRERILANFKRKYANNPRFKAVIKARQQNRKARKLSLPNTFTEQDWLDCLDYFGYRCAACGSTDHIQADHFIPLTDPECPGTTKSNMIPLCRSCNNSKHANSPFDWFFIKFGSQGEAILSAILDYLEFCRLSEQ